MKGRIVFYDWAKNRAILEFDPDFSQTYEKYKGKDVNVEVKAWKPKRSGAANRYMWTLADRIAKEWSKTKHFQVSKEDVYRDTIRDIGGCSSILLMLDEAVDRFCEQWEKQGIGWQTERIPVGDGNTNVIAYYGSSTFDRDQMAELINKLIWEAEELGIDTDTPDRALWWESLEEEYGNSHIKDQAN